jgi:hypothetical protein
MNFIEILMSTYLQRYVTAKISVRIFSKKGKSISTKKQ